MTIDDFLNAVLAKLLDEAAIMALPNIPSKTLQANLEQKIYAPGYGSLYLDPYWAVLLHDGRNKISKAPLIWFRNPSDDPRLRATGRFDPYLARAADYLGPLTQDEWRYWSAQNRLARKEGRPESMIVRWKGVAGVQGSYFFDNDVGMKGFREVADRIVRIEFEKYLQEELKDLLVRVTDPLTARLP